MENENTNGLDLKLLEERIWNVDDKLNIALESQADLEADFIRMKQRISRSIERLDRLEQEAKRGEKEVKDD